MKTSTGLISTLPVSKYHTWQYFSQSVTIIVLITWGKCMSPTCTAIMTVRATRWLKSLPINTFVDNLEEARNIWKMRFVFTNMGPNINVKEKWNPTLPKMQSPSFGLSMYAKTVANARYMPIIITRSICSPDPLTTRRCLFLVIITDSMMANNRTKPAKPANIVPYISPQVKNVRGISMHSIWLAFTGHCFSGHPTQEVSLSTRISFLRHAKHFQQQNGFPITLKCAAGHGALHRW